MPEFEELVAEILRRRPDIGEGELRRLIEEKKSRVGAGYLTDSGAAFLVASDLNVPLKVSMSFDLSLGGLYVGASEVTVVGRIFTIYPVKTYVKKDGSEGRYRRLTLFDGRSYVSVTLWNGKAGIEDLGVSPNTTVRLRKGYVRAALDGRPVIHLGERGEVEVVKEEEVEGRLLTIEKISQDVSSVTSPQVNLAVTGLVKSPPRLSEFTRRDGRMGRVVQLHLDSQSGGRRVRVAVWDNESTSLLNIPPDSHVRLVGIKSRVMPDGSIELHGDEATFVEILSAPKQPGMVESGRFRILSIGTLRRRGGERVSASLLVVDGSGSFYTLVLIGDAATLVGELNAGSLIECRVREIGFSTLICERRGDVKVLPEDDASFLTRERLSCKIRDVTESPTPLILEVIALSRASSQQIVTRRGETVEKAEVIVGDETKEIRLVAWRDLAESLTGIVPGERLRLIGVVPSRGQNGAPVLQMKSYSRVERAS